MAYLAITVFITISALVSVYKPWFVFIYRMPGRDLLAHFVGMGLLSFFMVLGFSSRATRGHSLDPLVSMAAATLLVTLDEVIQLVIPSRTFSLDDLAWSLAGVLVFGLAAAGIDRIRRQRGQL